MKPNNKFLFYAIFFLCSCTIKHFMLVSCTQALQDRAFYPAVTSCNSNYNCKSFIALAHVHVQKTSLTAVIHFAFGLLYKTFQDCNWKKNLSVCHCQSKPHESYICCQSWSLLEWSSLKKGRLRL